MFGIKKRRTLIRVLSYTVSAFLLTIIYAAVSSVAAYKYRMSIEYSYERAMSELSEHVDNIDIALRKGYYASTSAQLVGLTAQIWSDAGAAMANLSQMPLSKVDLSNTYKFLAQVGDYADVLGKQVAQNQTISEEDRTNIKNLSGYAVQLSAQLSDIESNLQSGQITLFKSEAVLHASNLQEEQQQVSIEDGFLSIETTFSGLPSMIYDGPFSDNLLKKIPTLTTNQAEIPRDQARQIAAAFLGTAADALADNAETAGDLPTYDFVYGTTSISVSKNGGYVVRFLNSESSSEKAIDQDTAISKASGFLQSHGITGMRQTYFLSLDGTSTVNFAYSLNDVIFYPDLIKIGVSMADGSIISYDATGYIMNHPASRSIPSASVSEKAVRAKLNPHLTVLKQSMAVIPTNGGNEALCYEYKCLGDDGQSVIVYFNAQTGAEQQDLILTDTPGGTLAI